MVGSMGYGNCKGHGTYGLVRDETHHCVHSHHLKGCQGGLVNELMKTILSHHKHGWEAGTCECNHDTKGAVLHDGGKWQQP